MASDGQAVVAGFKYNVAGLELVDDQFEAAPGYTSRAGLDDGGAANPAADANIEVRCGKGEFVGFSRSELDAASCRRVEQSSCELSIKCSFSRD
jgi:hypothetical protein